MSWSGNGGGEVDPGQLIDVVSSLSDVIYVIQLEPEFRFEYVTDSVTDLVGYTPQDHYDDPTLGVRLVDPEDLPRLGELSQTPAGEVIEYTLRWVAKDGRRIWTNHRCRTERRDDGSLLLLGVARDVTPLKAAKERYRLLAEHSSDVVAMLNASGDIDWLSTAISTELRWDPSQVSDWSVLVHPDDLGTASQLLTGTGGEAEVKVLTGDGAVRLMSAASRRLPETHDEHKYVVSMRDITADREIAQRVAASEENFRLLAENSLDVVMRLVNGVVEWVSPSLSVMLGWQPEDWTGREFAQMVDPRDRTVANEGAVSGEGTPARLRIRGRDRTLHWIELRTNRVPTSDDRSEVVAAFRTIDDVIAYEAELRRKAFYDDLTGALKRDEAIRILENMMTYRRQPGPHSAVLFCDLDRFKQINDTCGHVCGDRVLRTTAHRLRQALRAGDTLARMGGDEFLIVLDGVDDLAQARAIAAKLADIVRAPIEAEDKHIVVTMSVGVTLRHPQEDPDRLIARADQAMYIAKGRGRDQIVTI